MYRIVDWEKHFENNRTRELKTLAWVPFPNKHDGDGYTELLLHKDGAAHYGAWCALVQVASKCDPRGTLLRDGARPHTATSLSRMTHVPEAIMQSALNRLVSPIGWIEVVPDPVSDKGLTEMSHEGATPPHLPASRVRAQEGKGMEGNGTEQKGTEGKTCAADAAELDNGRDLRDWLVWWNSLHSEQLVPAGVNEDEPSQGVGKAWERVQRKNGTGKRLRELLTDRDAIEREIRASSFCREPWFRLEKLLCGSNRDGELIVQKLLDGGYREGAKGSDDPRGNFARLNDYLLENTYADGEE